MNNFREKTSSYTSSGLGGTRWGAPYNNRALPRFSWGYRVTESSPRTILSLDSLRQLADHGNDTI